VRVGFPARRARHTARFGEALKFEEALNFHPGFLGASLAATEAIRQTLNVRPNGRSLAAKATRETLKYSAFPAAQGRAAKIGGCKPLIL
jgi:hypothetical protein